MSLKNSNDTIENRTRDLPVYSVVHYSIILSRIETYMRLCPRAGSRYNHCVHGPVTSLLAKQQFFLVSLVRAVFSHMGYFFMQVSHCQKYMDELLLKLNAHSVPFVDIIPLMIRAYTGVLISL